MSEKLKNVAAVIRTYNNPHVGKAVKNMLAFGLGKVIVVVNGTLDKGSTRGYLDTLAYDHRVAVIEMHEGYTWSNALNRALSAIRLVNAELEASSRPTFKYILNVSVEAQFHRVYLETMVDGFGADLDGIAVVGTTFQGIQDGNKIDLGRSYRHPRNTGMMLKLSALDAFCNSFDNWCDEIGGMEDIEFVLRLKAFTDKTVKMLDLRVPLIVGKHYHQPTKEEREREAMQKIVARMRSFRDRIEDVIREMRLEE